jgi:hypothetical protein
MVLYALENIRPRRAQLGNYSPADSNLHNLIMSKVSILDCFSECHLILSSNGSRHSRHLTENPKNHIVVHLIGCLFCTVFGLVKSPCSKFTRQFRFAVRSHFIHFSIHCFSPVPLISISINDLGLYSKVNTTIWS